MVKPSEPTPCPGCGEPLTMRRIEDLTVVEYQARCLGCSWTGTLRELPCGGCHGHRLFKWTDGAWRCTRCGHIRGDQSPPRAPLEEPR
jgi:DnaJ-class molecular chaperone